MYVRMQQGDWGWGRSPKNFFRPSGRQFGLKIKGAGSLPLDPPLPNAIYLRKPEIPVGKSKGSRHSVREGAENMGCDLSCVIQYLSKLSSGL